jgi:hypothetical protein
MPDRRPLERVRLCQNRTRSRHEKCRHGAVRHHRGRKLIALYGRHADFAGLIARRSHSWNRIIHSGAPKADRLLRRECAPTSNPARFLVARTNRAANAPRRSAASSGGAAPSLCQDEFLAPAEAEAPKASPTLEIDQPRALSGRFDARRDHRLARRTFDAEKEIASIGADSLEWTRRFKRLRTIGPPGFDV